MPIVLMLALAAANVVGQGGRTYPAARQGGNDMHNYYLAPAPSSAHVHMNYAGNLHNTLVRSAAVRCGAAPQRSIV